MIPKPKYDSFSSLPAWAQSAILKFCCDDGDTWALKPIPALDGKCFIEVMNSEGGETKVRSYLMSVIGKFFPDEVDAWQPGRTDSNPSFVEAIRAGLEQIHGSGRVLIFLGIYRSALR